MTSCFENDPASRPSFTELLKSVEKLPVGIFTSWYPNQSSLFYLHFPSSEVSIDDPIGCSFWMKYFPSSSSVSWESFLKSFLIHMKILGTSLLCSCFARGLNSCCISGEKDPLERWISENIEFTLALKVSVHLNLSPILLPFDAFKFFIFFSVLFHTHTHIHRPSQLGVPIRTHWRRCLLFHPLSFHFRSLVNNILLKRVIFWRNPRRSPSSNSISFSHSSVLTYSLSLFLSFFLSSRSLSHFSLHHFCPLLTPTTHTPGPISTSKPLRLLQLVSDIVKKKFFHGDVDTPEAIRRLSQQPEGEATRQGVWESARREEEIVRKWEREGKSFSFLKKIRKIWCFLFLFCFSGTYLVRFSTRSPGTYTLSVRVSASEISHIRLQGVGAEACEKVRS